MSKAKFTPGPWVAQKDLRSHKNQHGVITDGPYAWGVYGPKIMVAQVVEPMEFPCGTTDEECDANARLIAAAPALYTALKAVGAEDEGPCRYDHHGNCQAHRLQPKGACYIELAVAALALVEGCATNHFDVDNDAT